jgi:hypothetical protein
MPTEPQHDEGPLINTTSWRIVTILVILSAVAAGLLFATGLKANAESAPTHAGHTGAAPPFPLVAASTR